ncbi:MAG: hypothetical protein QOF33_2767 [Thermomicrobiales bacterium]|nr:hypothetical protein [Thermomicrobiales bacterium]
MVISDPAFVVVEDTRSHLLRRLGSLRQLRWRKGTSSRHEPSLVPGLVSAAATDVAQFAAPSAPHMEAATSPVQTSVDAPAREIVLTADERRARAIALRGLSQSRAHRFDSARASFIEATEMDPALDLAKLPDFWRLPLGAQQAAIEAYEHVGRRRDAAALTAAVRSTFRPKLFRPRPVPHAALPES